MRYEVVKTVLFCGPLTIQIQANKQYVRTFSLLNMVALTLQSVQETSKGVVSRLKYRCLICCIFGGIPYINIP